MTENDEAGAGMYVSAASLPDWLPAGFKVRLPRANMVKCCHRDDASRCEAWASWSVPARPGMTGDQATRYYCLKHVPDLPERLNPTA